MPFYKVCPACGANLDPGERCNCIQTAEQKGFAMNGITFDNKRELERYAALRILKKSGKIEELVLQPEFMFQESFAYTQGKEETIFHEIRK